MTTRAVQEAIAAELSKLAPAPAEPPAPAAEEPVEPPAEDEPTGPRPPRASRGQGTSQQTARPRPTSAAQALIQDMRRRQGHQNFHDA